MQGLMLDTHGSQHVTLDALRTLPIPQPLGTRHQPIPHAVLVDALVEGITDRGWTVHSTQLGVAAKGAALFGTMDLRRQTDTDTEIGTLFGFRSSTNSSLSIQGVAGKRVFVCSNMCFSGDMFVMRRKSTTRIDLPATIADGLDQFLGITPSKYHGLNFCQGTIAEMCRDLCAGVDCRIDILLGGVGVAQRYDNSISCQLLNKWKCALDFWCKRHHTNPFLRNFLPSLEFLPIRFPDVLLIMRTPWSFLRGDIRSFDMNAYDRLIDLRIVARGNNGTQ